MIMVHKIYFILFYSILSYLGGGFFSHQAFAASVIKTIEKENLPHLPPKIVRKKPPSYPSEQFTATETKETLYFPSHFRLSSKLTSLFSPPRPSNKALKKPANTKSTQNAKLHPSPSTQVKKLVTDNKQKKFVHDSLILFSQTRQFLKETDLMLHNLTQNILLSLNLGTQAQKGIFVLSKEDDVKNYSAKTSFKQQIEINKIQSLMEINKNDDTYNNNDLLALLFNIQNLYYLIGFVFLFLIFKQILNFVLLKDQYNSQNRR